MKSLKSFIVTGAIALVMMLTVGNLACAQTIEEVKRSLKNSTPEKRADFLNKLMQQELNLSTEQYAKVSRLNLEYAKQIQFVIDSDDNQISKAWKAKSILDEKDKKLKTVFTKSQYEKYQQFVKTKTAELKKQYQGYRLVRL